ncbi:MAG: SMC-Scp complex subunit ScpB [Methylovulum miyakonense]
MEIQRIVEAILFAAKRPMTCKQVREVFPELEQPDLAEIQDAIDAIIADYQPRGIELAKIASGYRFQVRSDVSRWVSRLFEEKPPKYSKALMETLAIIAYRQPVTRGDIEDIRGVSVSTNMIQTLLEREWVRILGHKEVPGRPALYGTTKQFLDYFNLSTLNELPTLQELQGLELSAPETSLADAPRLENPSV